MTCPTPPRPSPSPLFPSRTDTRRALALAGCGLLLMAAAGCIAPPKKNAASTLVASRKPAPAGRIGAVAGSQSPAFLSYRELSEIAAMAGNPGADCCPDSKLESKVDALFRRPAISNQAWRTGKRPSRAVNPEMGEFVRVASWNIEKSLKVSEIAAGLASRSAFEAMIDPRKAPPGSAAREELLRQRDRVAEADVILLQEVDLGMPRSGYVDAAKELAAALGMNYAFAPQQIELEPLLEGAGAGVDPKRFRGVFGSAVLSRYPVRSARCFPLETQPYDWTGGELAPVTHLEKAKRLFAKAVFHADREREVKVGGRGYFQVDLAVPGMPANTLTVVAAHLEIRSRPRDREIQLRETLSYVQRVPHVVVVGGDFNSTSFDLSPTSLARVVSRAAVEPETWLAVGLAAAPAVPAGVGAGRVALNSMKNFHSPMALDIPVVLPNDRRQMFRDLEDYRFDDGGAFDFRGSRERSINGLAGKLANSGERKYNGRVAGFSLPRPIGPVGTEPLDWLFVKIPPTAAGGEDTYRYAPHFGETLTALGKGLSERWSDHVPCVVDLPLGEPPLGRGGS